MCAAQDPVPLRTTSKTRPRSLRQELISSRWCGDALGVRRTDVQWMREWWLGGRVQPTRLWRAEVTRLTSCVYLTQYHCLSLGVPPPPHTHTHTPTLQDYCAYDQPPPNTQPSIPAQLGYWQQIRDALNSSVRVFRRGFCHVRVSTFGLRLLYGARFSTEVCTRCVPLSFTLLLRLKCCHVCDQCHSSRVLTPAYWLTL
jgi:hypothetical protein